MSCWQHWPGAMTGAGNVEPTGREVRAVLDRHLAPPPERIEVDGRALTPNEYAFGYLGIDPGAYVELMSYTGAPFYDLGEVDVPNNWRDYAEYVNVPLDAFLRTINRALDGGYSVAFDTDWGDPGAAWNQAWIAVIRLDMTPGYAINQGTRQADFEGHRTTDDQLLHAVDHRLLEGWDWYLIKNSHGTATGRQGYVRMRRDWLALRVLNVMMHRDALGGELLEANRLGSALSGGPGLSEPLNPAGLLEAPRAR